METLLQTPDRPVNDRCEICSGRQQAGDVLTGLADRSGFRAQLTRTLALEAPALTGRSTTKAESAVLLVDLNKFKAVNDAMGHAIGDALLVAVARRIRFSLREGDLAARIGGNEFAILLDGVAGPDDVARITERLVDLLARPYVLSGSVVNIAASIGAAIAPAGTDADILLRRAGMAMHQARSDSRSRWCLFRPDMQDRADANLALETDLRAALALGQYEVFYQPQLNLETRQLVGFEALLRWRHPARGLVQPDNFIPLLERLDLISSVGAWVIRQACLDAVSWPQSLTVAVNVAAAQFDDAALTSIVASSLQASGLPGTRLELEILETVLLTNDSAVMDQLHALKALGVQISLDDFGTGYSSLTQLRSFPFDRVKIDRSFADDPAVVRAVAALGAGLGMRTTAEGVETPEQLERLERDGCTEAQGYLLSRPVAKESVAGIIARFRS